jgi:hypothetical protein
VAADDFGDCNVLGDDRDAATLLMSSITSVGTYNGIDNSATANNSIDGGSPRLGQALLAPTKRGTWPPRPMECPCSDMALS